MLIYLFSAMDAEIILALDISTSTIGVSVIKSSLKDGYQLLYDGYYKPLKEGSIFKRLAGVKEYILNIIEQYNPDNVIIEDIVQFMKRKSGAKTIIPLAVFNRTVGFVWFEYSGKEPIILNVLKIRHAIKHTKKLPEKEDIPEVVSKHLNIKPIYYYKVNKKTKQKEIMVESFDMNDSIAVGLAYLILKSRGKLSQPKKTVRKRKSKKKK